MTVLRAYVLRDASIAAQLLAFIKANAQPAVDAGHPLHITVAEYHHGRSNAMNAFQWGPVLKQISEQVQMAGRWVHADVWHEFFCREYLPELSASGVPKWRYLPDGGRELLMGTSDLNSDEMDQYLLAVQSHAAVELGVIFDNGVPA